MSPGHRHGRALTPALRLQTAPQRADEELHSLLVDAVEEQLDSDAEGDGQQHSCAQRFVQDTGIAIPAKSSTSSLRDLPGATSSLQLLYCTRLRCRFWAVNAVAIRDHQILL